MKVCTAVQALELLHNVDISFLLKYVKEQNDLRWGMLVDTNILSSLLENCLWTAKVYIALHIYMALCMMDFFTYPFLHGRE